MQSIHDFVDKKNSTRSEMQLLTRHWNSQSVSNSLRNWTVTQCILIATIDMRRGIVPFPSGIHQWTQFVSVFIGVLDGISLSVFYCEQCQEKKNSSLRLWMTPTICVCRCAAQWTGKGNNFLRLWNTTTNTNCQCFDRILTNEHISR